MEADRDLLKGFGELAAIDEFRDAVESTRRQLDADIRDRATR